MTGWLRTWNQPSAAPSGATAGGTSEQQIAALRKAPDDQVGKRFLDLLIAHQDDAVLLARTETAGGANPVVIAFAEQVDQSRTAEIKQMQGWQATS